MSRVLFALTSLVALAGPASGQPAPVQIEPVERHAPESDVAVAPATRLEALVAEALTRSPALAAARSELAARREMESPAGALPDPMLEAMLQNAGLEPTVGKEEMSMVGVEARQALPYPGKRAAARAVAAAETVRSAAALAALERQVAAEVRTLFAGVYALDREREALAAAAELVELLEEIAHSRYSAGKGDQEGVLKIQVEALRIAEKLGDLANVRRATVAELNRWLDRPGNAPMGIVDALPDAPPVGADAELLAAAGSAEVARAAAAQQVADRRVALARLELKPNFSTGAGIASRGDLDPVVLLRFGVELPFWRRQKQLPMLRAAEQELAAARLELADAEAMARAKAAQLLSAWTNADEQAERYRQGILPQTSAALDAARASYLTGRGDFSTVIEDFNLWLEAHVALARREADRFSARAEFDRLAGIGSTPAGTKE